jgi:hypothetical protein
MEMHRSGLDRNRSRLMKRTRRILVARPGSRVDAYCYTMGERKDEGET